jgi:hypothetical protein
MSEREQPKRDRRSTTVLAQQETASVFDILYADESRLASLLSQMGNDGVLKELTRLTEVASDTSGGFDLKLAKMDTKEAEKRSISRTFDPRWLVPLLFLDKAASALRRDISTAEIGSLVLVTGKLVITDVGLIHSMWNSPAMKRHILKSMLSGNEEENSTNRHDRRSSRKSTAKQDTTEQEALFEIMPHMPHSPQINIISNEKATWATIDPKHLVGTVQDLTLKHGPMVSGEWSLVGIYDAKPFSEDDPGFMNFDDLLAIGALQESLWKVAVDMAMPIRQALGRPFLSYGVTPLLIFREIATT